MRRGITPGSASQLGHPTAATLPRDGQGRPYRARGAYEQDGFGQSGRIGALDRPDPAHGDRREDRLLGGSALETREVSHTGEERHTTTRRQLIVLGMVACCWTCRACANWGCLALVKSRPGIWPVCPLRQEAKRRAGPELDRMWRRRTAAFGVLSLFGPACLVVEFAHRCFVFYISGQSLAENKKMTEENQSFKLVNDAFPNIGKSILMFWGHPDFHELMEGLQQEKEGRARAGFPPDVLNALFDLTSEHDETFPELAPQATGIWALHGKAGALQALR